jgi:predicted RNA-binding protein associated with RNAse of E/G family
MWSRFATYAEAGLAPQRRCASWKTGPNVWSSTWQGCTFYVASQEDGTLVKDGLEWAALRPLPYTGLHCLFFVYPGHGFAIRATWMGQPRTFTHWYINLQEAIQRSAVGVSTSDQVLDVIIEPDRETWSWKDEAAFEAAVRAGRFTEAEAIAIRAEGLRAVEMARNGAAPFNEGWERWQPDPSWPVPVLPEGWDVPRAGLPDHLEIREFAQRNVTGDQRDAEHHGRRGDDVVHRILSHHPSNTHGGCRNRWRNREKLHPRVSERFDEPLDHRSVEFEPPDIDQVCHFPADYIRDTDARGTFYRSPRGA